NVQGTMFNRYIPIFIRKKGSMNFPVSIITDMDISPKSHYVHKSEESKTDYPNIKKPQTLQQIKKEVNRDWTNEQVKEHFEIWDYTEGLIDQIKSDVEKEKKEE